MIRMALRAENSCLDQEFPDTKTNEILRPQNIPSEKFDASKNNTKIRGKLFALT